MSSTVQNIIDRVSVDLQEDPTFTTNGIWTVNEIIGYVNYAETDFQRRTGILKTSVTVSRIGVALYTAEFFGAAMFVVHVTNPSPFGGSIFPKPLGTMDIERVSYDKKRLYRQTLWDLSRENLNWKNNPYGRPKYYYEDGGLPINTFSTERLPATILTFRLFCDILPTVNTLVTATLTIPDTWVQYIAWEVLSLCLSRDGDGQDIARSSYSHSRYIFGVNLCLRLIRGETQEPVVAVGSEQQK
jgi:hypothetical protein